VRRKMSSPPRSIAHDDLFVLRVNCPVRRNDQFSVNRIYINEARIIIPIDEEILILIPL